MLNTLGLSIHVTLYLQALGGRPEMQRLRQSFRRATEHLGQALESDKWGGSWGKTPWFYLGPEVAGLGSVLACSEASFPQVLGGLRGWGIRAPQGLSL